MIDSPEPYAEPLEHLTDELRRWEIRLELEALRWNAAPPGEQPLNEVPGLFLNASEARSLTQGAAGDSDLAYSFDQADRLKELDARLRARLERMEGQGATLPLYRLRDGFGLGELGYRCLLALAAPHADRRFDKLYRYLQEDYVSPSLSIDLMIRLCGDDAAERRGVLALLTESDSPLSKLLVPVSQPDGVATASLLSGTVRLRKRVVHALLGLEWAERGPLARLRTYRVSSSGELPTPLVNGEVLSLAGDYVRRAIGREGATALLAYGPPGSGKTFLARHACAAIGKPLLEWDLRDAPVEEETFLDAVDRLLLEAKLQDAVPAFDCLHGLRGSPTADANAADRRLEKLMERLDAAWSGPLFLLGEEETRTTAARSPSLVVLPIALDTPDIGERRRLWETMASGTLALPPEEADVLAGRFLFTPGQIKAVIGEARKAAEWRRVADPGDEAVPISDLLHLEAYRLIDHRLKEKATKLAPRFGWDDLVLPPDTLLLLRRACDRVRFRHTVLHEWGFESKLPYGKGTSMLFTGPPGTGKTMAAMVMAREMNAELYRVDLSRVVSKYVGETEKNLGDIFDEARRSGAILFFDEADALFGKRSEVKDAHDKYANMETSYLLQKMEEYDGLTILASNFSQNLDDAFQRRIPFIVKFPFPDAVQRERLWRSALPRKLPTLELDFPFLAQTFELAGGPIKNIVVTAAFLAASEGVPVSMKQIVEGVVQEYKKTGKVLLKDRLGAYADYGKG